MVKVKVEKDKKKKKEKTENQEFSNFLRNFVAFGEFSIEQLILPVLDFITKQGSDGLQLVVITFSREKAFCIRKLVKPLVESKNFTIGLVVDGNSALTESVKIEKNPDVLICTAGKLGYHIENTKKLNLANTKFLIIDELDTILSLNESNLSRDLMNSFPSNKNIRVLIKNNSDLASSFLNNFVNDPQLVEKKTTINIENLDQKYVKVEPLHKFLLLYTFLFRNQSKKTLVLFSCSSEAKFYKELLNSLNFQVVCSHSLQSAEKNEKAYSEFLNGNKTILLSTENNQTVFSDFLIEFDFPKLESYSNFVRKLENPLCKIIFFVNENDLAVIQNSSLKFTELKFSSHKLLNIQAKVEKLIEKNYNLHRLARGAYRDYVLSTACKDYHSIAKAFGLAKAFLVNGLKN